jgi:signal peptidase I
MIWTRRTRSAAEAVFVLAATIFSAILLRTFVVEAYRVPTRSMESTLLAGDFVFVNKLAYGLRGGPWPSTSTIAPLVSPASPRRGDVIAFRQPGPDPSSVLIKRCVAVPGDSVLVVEDRVVVNGFEGAGADPSTPPPPPAGSAGRRPPMTDRNSRLYFLPRRGQSVVLDSPGVGRWRHAIEAEGHTLAPGPGKCALVDSVPRETYTFRDNQFFVLGDNSDDSRDSRAWGPLLDERIIGKAILIYWSRDEARVSDSFGSSLTAIRWPRIGTVVR